MEPQPFDITTKAPDSSTTWIKHYKGYKPKESEFEAGELMPEGYETHLMREELIKKREADPFKLMGVSGEDKMAFFLLKWVFNAIKIDSDLDDPKLMGNAYVTKK